MNDKILVVIKRVGEEPTVDHVENTLKGLQEAVGGHLEVLQFTSDVAFLVDEEGILKNKPHNTTLLNCPIVGTIVAVGTKGENFTNLRSSTIPTVLRLLKGELT